MPGGVQSSLATQRGIGHPEEPGLQRDRCSLALLETASESTSPKRQQGLGAVEEKGEKSVPTPTGPWGLGDRGGDSAIFLSKGVG